MKRHDIGAIMQAMRAAGIPEGNSGLWTIKKQVFTERDSNILAALGRAVPAGEYTFLRRYTNSTLMVGGEIVMEDTPPELQKHLQGILMAYGRVLVTGLGLGCCIRGLLARSEVTRIDVVERDFDVLQLVRPHMPTDRRLHIHHAEAELFLEKTDMTWDTAWHDVWTDTDTGEDHLAVKHQRLMSLAASRVPLQSAWAFPKKFKAFNHRTGRIPQLELTRKES